MGNCAKSAKQEKSLANTHIGKQQKYAISDENE